MDEGSDRTPSLTPNNIDCDTIAFPNIDANPGPKLQVNEPAIFPAAGNASDSVVNARVAVWAVWRTDRGADSDESKSKLEEEEYDHSADSESLEDEFPGLEDDEDDTQSVDDRIEAEWEKEWAEIGALFHFYTL